MAQPLLRPFFNAARSTSSSSSSIRIATPLSSRRCFSQVHALGYAAKGPSAASQLRRPQKMGHSIRVVQKDGAQIPNDLGLLDGTFITPTGANRPSPLTSPRATLSLLWTTLKLRLRDRISLLILKLSSPRDASSRSIKFLSQRRMRIGSRGSIAAAAIALHRQMYTAYAAADSALLSRICADGLNQTFISRIAQRSRDEEVRWELVRYERRAKVVSDRATRLPIEGAAIRQAVVRIQSVQKLTRTRRVRDERTGSVREVVLGGSGSGNGKEKATKEYLVLQKRTEGWVEGEWQIWGTTKETSLEDVRAWERRFD